MADKKDTRICINNREISHKYEILERVECGIELKGTEVKSIRDSKCNLKNSFALINGGEVILKNMHISPYEMGNINNVPEKKDRKLLLHKLEILKMIGYIKQGGYTLVPSKIYTRGRWFKLELCICKGKKIYDKRDIILQNEAKRQINEFKKAKAN
ncbi:MAG: SsrA-binding protein SmpB [Clostridia bacterium]|nr:SsrA-binding protein SmpB [Clostridia bacterium]MDD4386810.1 SsrA-binding protein SmpB [Clostridia bacterium]